MAKVLGITNPREMTSRLDASEKDDVSSTDAIGRGQKLTTISESGTYFSIMQSRKENARPFQSVPLKTRKGYASDADPWIYIF